MHSFASLPFLKRFHPIWQNPAFLWLWLSTTIGNFGGQITAIALPIIAVSDLHATPEQMGWLIALETLPFALFSLPSGVWIERIKKLPLMKINYIALVVVIGSIPVAAWFQFLNLGLLYFVGFMIGICNVFLGTAMQVFTTQVVNNKDHLVHAHGAISAVSSAARTAGPGVGGALIQVLTASFVLVVDCCALLIGLLMIMRIKHSETLPAHSKASFITQIREGLAFVFKEPSLKVLTWAVAAWQVLFHGVLTLEILLASRDLALSPKLIGIGFAAGGATAVIGSLIAPRLSDRFSVGTVMTVGFGLTALGWCLLAFAPAGTYAPWSFACAQIFFQAGVSLFFVTYIAMRQVLTPEHLLSRVTATMRFLTVAATPLGALLAGFLGQQLGVRNALIAIAISSLLLTLGVVFGTPLRKLSQQNDKAEHKIKQF
jgi:MFS family permease